MTPTERQEIIKYKAEIMKTIKATPKGLLCKQIKAIDDMVKMYKTTKE